MFSYQVSALIPEVCSHIRCLLASPPPLSLSSLSLADHGSGSDNTRITRTSLCPSQSDGDAEADGDSTKSLRVGQSPVPPPCLARRQLLAAEAETVNLAGRGGAERPHVAAEGGHPTAHYLA